MKVNYSKGFDKSVEKLKDKIAVKRLSVLIKKIENAQSFSEIPNVKPLTNHYSLYRIRTSDFRLIVEYIDGSINILLIEYLKRDDNTYKKYN